MVNYRSVLLVAFLGIVVMQTLAFAEYMRRLGKRLKARSTKVYKDMMPSGWLRAAFGRNSLGHGYGAMQRLREAPDQTLQQEGRNLKTVYNFLLIIELLTLALLIKSFL